MRRMESTRRWKGAPRLTASDVVVWFIVTAMVFGALIGLCALLTVAWPS